MIEPVRQFATSIGVVASVFASPDMRRLQLAWGGVSFAIWSFAIALAVYAFDVGGASAVGIAGLVRLLPGALASPFGGLLGDRYSRRSTLALSALCASLAIAGSALAVALDAPAAAVFALAGLFTAALSPYVPAEGALLPVVARTPQELSAANVARSVMDNGGFLAGSVLTGILLATTSPQVAFAAAALASAGSAAMLARLSRDERPIYAEEAEDPGLLHETAAGARALLGDARLRLLGAALTLLVFFEGAADVLLVILALDLLGLSAGSVGYLNAAWGIGALFSGAALAFMLHRGRLAVGLLAGSLLAGAGVALPGIWAAAAVAYLAWASIGVGYIFVDVAARTLLQRLGSDETLARALGFLETSRLAAMAFGSIAAPALVTLFGIRGALVALGAVLPAFAVAFWTALRSVEIGAPVDASHYALLRGNSIFAPLPVDTLERLTRDLAPVSPAAGEEIITQGEGGESFYVIESGEVEVYRDGAFRCTQVAGESFGEIALLRDVPRSATVRATGDTRLLALNRDQFISVVTGHRRSREVARTVVEERLSAPAEPRR